MAGHHRFCRVGTTDVYCMLQLSYWPLAGMCGCGEVIRKCKLFKEGWWRRSLCLLDAMPWPGTGQYWKHQRRYRNVYCRRQQSKFCIERYSGCVVSTICDTLCFVIKTQTILSGHTKVPVFCVDYSRPAGKEGEG